MSLSIIIPTHQRPATLQRCLEYITSQTLAKELLEVIVVSDGEDRLAEHVVLSRAWPFSCRFSSIEKSQQGAARNYGVQQAKHDIILFIGDDIFLSPSACELHLARHKNENRPIAVLGFTTWDPAIEISPVMRWLETSGWQFGYPQLKSYAGNIVPKNLQHFFSYTSHISLPRSIALLHPFQATQRYGWEDIEWGLRLKNAEIPLLYESKAIAFHHHPVTLEQSLQRVETLGETAVEFSMTSPELDIVPHGIKYYLQYIQGYLPCFAGQHRRAFLCGVRKAKKRLHRG